MGLGPQTEKSEIGCYNYCQRVINRFFSEMFRLVRGINIGEILGLVVNKFDIFKIVCAWSDSLQQTVFVPNFPEVHHISFGSRILSVSFTPVWCNICHVRKMLNLFHLPA